jgi:hypothetical protein
MMRRYRRAKTRCKRAPEPPDKVEAPVFRTSHRSPTIGEFSAGWLGAKRRFFHGSNKLRIGQFGWAIGLDCAVNENTS